MSIPNSHCINSWKFKHSIQMSISKILILYDTKAVNISKCKLLSFRTFQNSSTFLRIEEFTLFIKKLVSALSGVDATTRAAECVLTEPSAYLGSSSWSEDVI